MSQVQTAAEATHDISEAVVLAVAEAKGVDPLELTPPLYDVIDPDALEHIFTPISTENRMKAQVSFVYTGYKVTVFGDGSVTVEEQ
jgi:hypothetical protein